MTRTEIAILACKILAMWVFAQAALLIMDVVMMVIFALANLHSGVSHSTDLAQTAVTGVPAVGAVIVGVLLWSYAPQFASRMVSAGPEPVTRPDLDHEAVLSVAFAAIGCWLLIPALRDVASIIFTAAFGKYPLFEYWQDSRWQARFWPPVFETGLSIWLIVGTRGVVRLVLMLRRRDGETHVLPPGGFEVLQPDASEDLPSESSRGKP